MHRLEVVGQTIISTTEIKSLVFDACPEIPIAGDEKAMRITNVIIERAAVPKVAMDVVEIAAERVDNLIIEQIAVVAFRWSRRSLHLVGRCAREYGRGGAKEKNGPKFILHGVVKAFVHELIAFVGRYPRIGGKIFWQEVFEKRPLQLVSSRHFLQVTGQ